MSASNPLQQTVCVWGMGGSPGSVGTYLLKNSAFAGLCGHVPHRNNFTLVKFKGHVKFDRYTLTLCFFTSIFHRGLRNDFLF